MAELKTKRTEASVDDFLTACPARRCKKTASRSLNSCNRRPRQNQRCGGSSIIGFGSTHLKYASGRELDWMVIGFSPRKQNLTLYLAGSLDSYADLLNRLCKHKISGDCLYIKTLKDVDTRILKEIIQRSVKAVIQK
jgi:hypothetical protein